VKFPALKLAGLPLHETLANPERPSSAEPLTVIEAEGLIAPSAGEVMLTSGGDRSRLMVLLALLVWPAASVAAPLTTWFAPSVVTVWGGGHTTCGTPPPHWKLTVTGELFQSAVLAAGEALATMVRGAS